MKRLLALLVCGGMIFSAGVSGATSISLDFNTLPSDQGWTYIGGSKASETNFSVSSGTTLTQNTLGIGTGDGTYSEYSLFDVVDPSLPFVLSVTARVLAEDGDPAHNSFGFAFAVITQTEWFGFGLGTSQIQGPLMEYISLNDTEFHEYRLEGTPGGNFDFFVDNIRVYTDGTPKPYTDTPQIAFGDFTNGTNASGEVTNLTFTQGDPIPEPATMLLLGSGLIGLVGARRKLRK